MTDKEIQPCLDREHKWVFQYTMGESTLPLGLAVIGCTRCDLLMNQVYPEWPAYMANIPVTIDVELNPSTGIDYPVDYNPELIINVDIDRLDSLAID